MPDTVTVRYRDSLSCGHDHVTETCLPPGGYDRIGQWRAEPELFWTQCFACKGEGKPPAQTIVQVVDMVLMEPPVGGWPDA